MSIYKPYRTSENGFTIPELMVVMVLTLMFTTMVMSFAFDFWGTAGSLQNSSDTFVTRQNLGDTLRNRLNVASSLMNQNSIPDVNAGQSDPTDPSGSSWTLLHAVPGAVSTPAVGTIAPVIYYSAPALDTSKNFIMRGVNPYQNEFVLYLNGTNKQLMLRTLAEPGASGNSVRTSCPEESVTPTCPADRILAEDVTGVTTKYFSKSGNVIDWNAVTDPVTGASIGPDFADVEVVELTISLKKRAVIHGTADSISQTTIRVALRNG